MEYIVIHVPLTLKDAGGRGEGDARCLRDWLPFCNEPQRVLKIFDFFKNEVGPRVKASF